MHAARAIHKQREKRVEKEKPEPRRSSASSRRSNIPHSPNTSIDRRGLKHQNDDSDNLNFSYVGFVIAIFGAVPLVVGTFVEVPALWECGLGLTLVGLFIGIVFWCTELCAEAKKFSQKKNKLSTRGKIEDSNLLQVPDRKFGNGLESRRGSFQSDSVSLIAPMGPHFTPKHLQRLHEHLSSADGSKNSISQYSSSDLSKSDESAQTLQAHRANGHLTGVGQMPPHPPPKLLLRGTGRKDDGRVVSLVQPDPGLDDESDSDAETVIEAPTGKAKIIQVQSCQEKGQFRRPEHLVTPTTTPTNPTIPTFSVENERVPPLNPLLAQHRTIRMPVMPQEVDKLQRCECGRYLLTERDKLIGIRLSGIGVQGGSMPATTYNSPSLTGIPGIGTAPATRKFFPKGSTAPGSQSAGALASLSDSTGSSENDISSQGTTPISNEHNIISVNSNESGGGESSKSENNKASMPKSPPPPVQESVVQVEPTLNSSDLLRRQEKTEGKEENSELDRDKKEEKPSSTKDPDDDQLLDELLTEMTAEFGDYDSDSEDLGAKAGTKHEAKEEEAQKIPADDDNDDEFEESITKRKYDDTTVQIEDDASASEEVIAEDSESQRKEKEQHHHDPPPPPVSQHPPRPTFLPLPVIDTDSQSVLTDIKNCYDDEKSTEASIDENCGSVTVMMSSASSTTTIVFIEGAEVLSPTASTRTASNLSVQQEQVQSNNESGSSDTAQLNPYEDDEEDCEEQFTRLRDSEEDISDSDSPKLKLRQLSLEEMLDKIERKQDNEVLAVVVQ